jgi:hypothetical protein
MLGPLKEKETRYEELSWILDAATMDLRVVA